MKFRDRLPLALVLLVALVASARAGASLSTYLDLDETTAPSLSGAGVVRLYASSSGHNVQVSANGGAFSPAVTVASLPSVLPASVLLDGGNTTGATVTVGTNDAQSLALETQGTTRVTLGTASLVSTFPVTLPTGSAAATSVQFTSDPNTGLYSPGADQAALVTGGTARFTLSTTVMTTTLPLRGQDGTASAPALSFSGDTNVGIFRATTDVLAFSTAGSERARIDAAGSLMVATTTSIAGKELLVGGDIQSTTGAYSDGTDTIVLSQLTGETGKAQGLLVTPATTNRRAEIYMLPTGTPSAGIGDFGVGTMGAYFVGYGTTSDNIIGLAAGSTAVSVFAQGTGASAPILKLGGEWGSAWFGCVEVDGAAGELRLGLTGQKIGFLGATAIVRPTVTGSRGGNAALADLLTELQNLGLIVDSSS